MTTTTTTMTTTHEKPLVTTWTDERTGLLRSVTTPADLGIERHASDVAEWKRSMACAEAASAARRSQPNALDVALAVKEDRKSTSMAGQRERIATAAMAALLACPDTKVPASVSDVVDLAVFYADALIKRLAEAP